MVPWLRQVRMYKLYTPYPQGGIYCPRHYEIGVTQRLERTLYGGDAKRRILRLASR